jgi:hypothetical protein
MIPIFNLRGYTAPDPLDRTPRLMRFVLSWIVSGVVAIVFLWAVTDIGSSLGIGSGPFPTYHFQFPWLFWVGGGLFTFVMGSLLVALRKSSSALFYLIIVATCVPADLFLQAQRRDEGRQALWTYLPGSFLDTVPVPWKFLVAWSFDGIIQGAIVLWLTRILASALYPAGKAKAEPTAAQEEALFPVAWTNEKVDKPRRDAGYWLLRLLGLGYLFYMLFCLLGILGSSPYPEQARMLIEQTYENPALAINTFSKISLMVVLAFIGAYNKDVRWHATLCLLVGHLASTAASLGFYFYAPPGSKYLDFLLASAIVDGVMVLIFVGILVAYRDKARLFSAEKEFPDFFSLPGMLNNVLLYAIGVAMALMVPLVIYLRTQADGASGLGAVYGYPDPQVGNTITKFTTMSLLAFLMARREKLRNYLFGALLLGLAVTFAGSVIWSIAGPLTGTGIQTRAGGQARVDYYFAAAAAVNGLAIALLIGFRKMHYNIDYVINSLNPSSARNVIALHDSLYGGGPESNAAALRRIDAHVAGVRGRRRGLLNFPFWVQIGRAHV